MTKEELEKEIRKYLKKTFHHEYYDDVVMVMGFAEPREKRIAELEAQIEKMKCCENCKHHRFWVILGCDLMYDIETECLKTKNKWELRR